MADNIGVLSLGLDVDKAGLSAQFNSLPGLVSGGMMQGFSKLGGMIGAVLGAGALAKFGKDVITMGSDLDEAQNVVGLVFGNMTDSVNAWSSNAYTKFGLSELMAKKYIGSLGMLLKSSGITGKALEEYSEGLTGLIGDYASLHNVDTEEVFKKFQMALGSPRGIMVYGKSLSQVNMQEYLATKGITKKISAMTQHERVLSRTLFLLEKSTLEMGDFERTSAGWANTTRSIGEGLKNIGVSIGRGLVAALLPAIQMFKDFLPTIQAAANAFRDFMQAIFGVPKSSSGGITKIEDELRGIVTGSSDASDNIDETGNSMKAAGKKAKGALAGFDQLNILTQKMADSAATSSDYTSDNSGAGNVDTKGVDAMKIKVEELKQIIGGIGKYFSDTFGPSFKIIGSMIVKEANAWWLSLKKAFDGAGTLAKPLEDYWTKSLVPAIQQAIPQISTTLGGLSESARMVFDGLAPIATKALDSITKNVLPVVTEMGSGMLTIGTTIIDNTKQVFDKVWLEAVQPGLEDAMSKIDETLVLVKDNWDIWGPGIITSTVNFFNGLKVEALKLWDTYLKPGFDQALAFLNTIWENGGKDLVNNFISTIGELSAGAAEFNEKVILPMVDWLINVLAPVFKNVWEGTLQVLKPVIDAIIGFVNGLLTSFKGIKEFILGVFTGDWKRAWGGIQQIFMGVYNSITSVLTGMKTSFSIFVNWMNSIFAGIWKKVWDGIAWVFNLWVTGVKREFGEAKVFFENIGKWFETTFTTGWSNAWDGIGKKVTTIGTSIQSSFKGVVNGVIKGINFMIKALNGLNIKMPDWIPGIGGQTAGFSIPEIPMLAKGGLAYSPQLAMVGDNRNARNDPEVVAPLSKLNNMVGGNNDNTETNDLLRQVLKAIQNQNLSVKIGESEFGRAAIKSINNVQRQAGSRLLIV